MVNIAKLNLRQLINPIIVYKETTGMTNHMKNSDQSAPQHLSSFITSRAARFWEGQGTEHKMYERVGAPLTMKYDDHGLLVHEDV